VHPYLIHLCAAEHRRDLLRRARWQRVPRIPQPRRSPRWPWQLRHDRRPHPAPTLIELGQLEKAHTGSDRAASSPVGLQELAER
jgi:hypothetical protein